MTKQKNFGPMQQALIESGLAEVPNERQHRNKNFTCRKCGKKMSPIPNTNVMACECGCYFIFNGRK